MQTIALIQAVLALSLAAAVTASAFCPVHAVRHRLGWLDAPAALPAALVGILLATVGLVLAGCAGRDASPVATVQAQDQHADCAAITAEIQANNVKVQRLADEQGWKTTQNVAAGVAGIVVWPLFFAMDLKGAASTEMAAMQARQEYLGGLADQRCRTAKR